MIKETLDYEKVFNNMVSSLVTYIRKSHLDSVVLGISGGIDSTVVAAILHEVSKEINKEKKFKFIGLSLPSSTNSKGEIGTAEIVGNAFCDVFSEKYIGSSSSTVFSDTSNIDNISSPPVKTSLRQGNIKARIRMIFLYDVAQRENGMVIGTDNYTEYLLGFSTIGGDDLFDYCPIQHLWKTEVYGLAKYIKSKYVAEDNLDVACAVDKSIKMIPTDGLGISESDMDQIGANSYYDVDEILQTHIEGGDMTECLKKYGLMVLNMVISRYRRTEFKRNHPVIPTRESYYA